MVEVAPQVDVNLVPRVVWRYGLPVPDDAGHDAENLRVGAESGKSGTVVFKTFCFDPESNIAVRTPGKIGSCLSHAVKTAQAPTKIATFRILMLP